MNACCFARWFNDSKKNPPQSTLSKESKSEQPPTQPANRSNVIDSQSEHADVIGSPNEINKRKFDMLVEDIDLYKLAKVTSLILNLNVMASQRHFLKV